MSSDSVRLRAYVGALVARERAVLAGAATLRLLALCAVGVSLGVLAAWRGWDRPSAVLAEVLLFGLGGLAAVVWPLVSGWRTASDPVRQARCVEAREPSLAGWMVVPVDALSGLLPGESAETVGWVSARAVAATSRHPPHAVHAVQALWGWAGGAATAWTLALAVLLAVPGGGGRVLGWWLGGLEAAASASPTAAAAGLAPARVGDLTLRYVYPDYTGLEPYEVVNSTGEARAVPGTRVEVTAKAAAPVESAGISAYEEALEASVTDGRTLRGSFVVRPAEGMWRLLTWEGGQLRASRDFPIRPEADLAPEVVLQSDAPTLEVAVNEPLDLAWLARDDFGVARVVLEVDGREVSPPLRVAQGRQAEVSGDLRRRPAELGMRVGGSYEVVVAAWDNDTVSGSKVGRSQAIRVVVLDEDGQSRVSMQERRELLKLLVTLLADHLEEPYPPGRSGGAFASWGEALHARYRPVAEFVEGFRNRRGMLVPDFAPVGIALEAGRTLIRYTQVSFVPDVRGQEPSPAHPDAVEAVTTFRDEAIATVEEAALSLDRLIRAAAYRAVAEAVAELREHAESVRASLEDPSAAAMMLVEAERALSDLADLAAELSEGGLQDLIQLRGQEARQVAEEARARFGAAQLDDGRRLGARAAQRMDDLAAAISEELQRRREEAGKQKSEAKKLLEALEALARKQDALASQVAELEERYGDARSSRMLDLWKQLGEQTSRVQSGVERYGELLRANGRPFNEAELVDWALEQSESASRAVEVQDLSGAAWAAVELDRLWRQYATRFDRLQRQGQAMGAPGMAEIGGVGRDVVRLLELLEQARRVDGSVDPATAESLRAVRPPQLGLEGELQTLQQDAKRMAQEMPVRPRGMEQSLEKADERMVQAADELGGAQGQQAQGSQGAAAQHIRDAIRSLQDAMAAAARAAAEEQPGSTGGEGQPGEGEDGAEGEEEGEEGSSADGESDADGEGGRLGGDRMKNDSFELPQPEEFRTPEAWRRALLEGMTGEVPGEYRALKLRYYEELVHQ